MGQKWKEEEGKNKRTFFPPLAAIHYCIDRVLFKEEKQTNTQRTDDSLRPLANFIG